jgi:hypothetical protein
MNKKLNHKTALKIVILIMTGLLATGMAGCRGESGQDSTIINDKPSKEAVTNIDYNSLLGASEAVSGERCIPDGFPYTSFVMPDGFEIDRDWREEYSRSANVWGSVKLESSDGKLTHCGSHTYLKSGDSKIYINYNFYGTLRTGYESGNPELYEKEVTKSICDHEAESYNNKYGVNVRVVMDPRGFNVLDLSSTIEPSFAGDMASTSATYAYLIPRNPKNVGLFIILVSDANAKTLNAVKQIFNSLTEPILTKADAERIMSEY